MAARGLTGTGGYSFLPNLEEVSQEPEFSKLFPGLAQLLQASDRKPQFETAGLSPQRRRLLEQAAEQARPAEQQLPKSGDGQLLGSEEQLLFLLSNLLAQEREEVRMETEAKLRAAFSAPPGERRTLIEAQRQKWRALEDTVKELSGLIRNPPEREKGMDPEEYRKMREMKASQSLNRLKSLEAASLRAKVIALAELVEIFQQPQHWKEAGGAVTSLLKMGMGEDMEKRIERLQNLEDMENRVERLQQLDPAQAAKMRQETEAKRKHLEKEMRDQIKDELTRQAEIARNLEHEEAARAHAAEIEEMQAQLYEHESEKQRMEAEIVSLRQANLAKEADEIEQRLKEETKESLSKMQRRVSQRASMLSQDNEALKKQLAEVEAKKQQMEEEAKTMKQAQEKSQEDMEELKRQKGKKAFNNKLQQQQTDALQKQAEESETRLKESQEQYERFKMQAAISSKLKGAAGAQKQAELQRQLEAAEKKMKDEENRGKVVNQMLDAVKKTQKEQRAQQHEQWKEDKNKLLTQMRNQQLEIASMAVLERQRLLRANRVARLENYRQQWWSEVDVQRLSTAKHLLLRCVRASKPAVGDDAAHAVKTVREALHKSQSKIIKLQELPNAQSSSIPEDESFAGGRGVKEQREQLQNGIRASDNYKRNMEPLLRQLVPGGEMANSSGFPSPSSRHAAVMEDAFEKERDKMEEARMKAHSRLLEAEGRLDALAKDEIAADLASNWAKSVGAMAEEKRMGEMRRKELQARIEDELNRETGSDIQRAKAASASAAAAAAASAAAIEVERQRAEEENKRRVEAALREADQQRLVPVRLKLNGFKKSQMKDKAAFEQAFAEKIRASLDLDESQLRVLEISAGTG